MISIDCSSSCPRWRVGCWPWPGVTGHPGHTLGNCPYVITPPPGTFITTHTVSSSSSTQHIHQQSGDTCRTQFGRRRCDDDCVYISICFTRHFLSCRVPGDCTLHNPAQFMVGRVLQLLVVTIMICLLCAGLQTARYHIAVWPLSL